MRAVAFVLAGTMLIGACGDDGAPAAQRAVSHADGWTIAVPADSLVTETTAGFDVLPEGDGVRRSPATIAVRLAEPLPSSETWQRREIAGVEAFYAVEVASGGSGGPEYRLQARRPLCGETLVVQQTIQREFGGMPDFEDAWAVVGSARCQAEP